MSKKQESCRWWWECQYMYRKRMFFEWIHNTFVVQRLVYKVDVRDKQIQIPSDFTYSMDYALALFLDNALTAFLRDSNGFFGTSKQFDMYDIEREELAIYIRNGFRFYHEFNDDPTEFSDAEEFDKRKREVQARCQESYELLGKHQEMFWW